ncbi:HIT domain-containing protein [uncultured Victivallis sp.]|uniref:HIT family protein n=1 Tax=uncultured Victivallis sp. TaxID=354118 RepID=UPI0025DCBAAF|nr:HIT domain-containing protein [uncultured Victivallis sp.]
MREENRPLWAPWRIEFIRGPKEKRCFLCGSEEPGDRPEEPLILHRGTHCFVMLNRYPYNTGHLLAAPYRHVGDLALLTREERTELLDLCATAEEALRRAMTPEAFNIGCNIGKAAGAGVADHLHMHIVPRWNGDNNFMPVLADIRCVPEALEATAELLKQHWPEA